MSVRNEMPVLLQELYSQAIPTITRVLDDVVPEICHYEWVAKYMRETGRNWDLDIIQKTILTPFNYYFRNRGKLYRPFVSSLILHVFDQDPVDYSYLLAMSEIVHVASLICDDIADESSLRRGKPTLHIRYGVPIAMNTAYTMLNYAALLVHEIKPRISPLNYEIVDNLLDQMIFSSCVGMAGDIAWSCRAGSPVPTPKVWQHTLNKTSPLTFILPSLSAALICSTKKEILESFREWGLLTGGIYQLVDDMLNLKPLSSHWGKDWAEDLDACKVNLLISYAFEHLNDRERDEVKELMSNHSLTIDQKKRIITLFEKTGAFHFIKKQVDTLRKQSDAVLDKSGLTASQQKPLKMFTQSISQRIG
jgi:geranylgeranyl diphosphate synthase, type I